MEFTFYQCRGLEFFDMRSAVFNNVTTCDHVFQLENEQLEGKIIVKDELIIFPFYKNFKILTKQRFNAIIKALKN